MPKPYDGLDRMPLAGAWHEGRSGTTMEDRDPYTGEVLLEIALADKGDLDRAYDTALAEGKKWAAEPPGVHAGVMRRAASLLEERREEFVEWIIRESGAVRATAELEVDLTLGDFYESASYPYRVAGRILAADIPGKESRVYRKPVGVVAVISPWNVPLHLTNRSLAPALSLGNAVVLKPASATPLTGGTLLAKLLEEAGLPPGVLSVVVGAGSEIGDAIVESEVPRVVSFTGSTDVGLQITRKAGLKKLSLELGGNGPLVVLDDADLGLAVDGAIFGKFFHSGQICMITNRIILDESVEDEFLERFLERVRALPIGDPHDDKTVIGPLIDKGQLDSVLEKVTAACADGAELLVGGEPTGPSGLVLPPHVLTGSNAVTTARQEVFGPVATIITASGEDDALALANDTAYGLSSAVFTRDIERGVRFARAIEAGMAHVNDSPVNDEHNTAFGGEKGSGLGRFGGDWAIEEFTTDQWVSIQHEPRVYPF